MRIQRVWRWLCTPRRFIPRDAGMLRHRFIPRDAGMNTAEYAMGTLAAVAFAGLLLKVLTSDTVQEALTRVIERALK